MPVMASREAGDRIDVGAGEGVGEAVGVEVAADAGDGRAGVKVQVNLTEAQVGGGHRCSKVTSGNRLVGLFQPRAASRRRDGVGHHGEAASG